jgi:uncharacterized protein YggE
MKNGSMNWVTGAIGIIALFAFLSILVLFPNGLTQKQVEFRVGVTASGAAYALPQQIGLSLYVNGTGTTTAAAVANLSASTSQLNQTLQGLVANNASDIQTTYYSVNKKYNSTYYVATEGIQVKVPSGTVSSAISQISLVPGVQIATVTPMLTPGQQKGLIKLALAGALANATAQAQVLAGNATITLGNVTTYSNFIGGYPSFLASSNSAAAAPVFFNSELGVFEQVSATFYKA